MITDEIATLIQEKNSFINKPTEDEVKQIISEINKFTTEEKLNELIHKYVSDTLAYGNESADMSYSISLLDQIQAILNKK